MRKRKMASLAALMAAFWLPCSSGIHAQDAGAADVNPASLSAEDFIRQFLGTTIGTISADGSASSQFVWFSQINETNAALISESWAVFQQLSPVTRQTVLMACEAHCVQYPVLVDQANAWLEGLSSSEPVSPPDQPGAASPQGTASKTEDTGPANAANTDPAHTEEKKEDGPAAGADSSLVNGDLAAPPVSEEAPSKPPAASSGAASQTLPASPQDEADSAAVPSPAFAADVAADPAGSASSSLPGEAPGQGSGFQSEPFFSPAPGALAPGQPAVSLIGPSSSEPAGQPARSFLMADLRQPAWRSSSQTETEETGEKEEAQKEDLLHEARTPQSSERRQEEADSEEDADSSKKQEPISLPAIDRTSAPDVQPEEEKPEEAPSGPAARPSIQPGAPTTLAGYEKADSPDPDLVFNSDSRPEGLVFEDYTEPFTLQEEAIIHALAAKAGFETFEVHPVTYIYENGDVKVSSAPIIKLSGPSGNILFQIVQADSAAAELLFLSDESCSYDGEAGVLSLSPAGQMHLELAAEHEKNPDEASGPDQSEENEPGDRSSEENEDKNGEGEKSDPNKEEDGSSPDSGSSLAAEDSRSVRPADSSLPESLDAASLELESVSESSQRLEQDAAATAFINRYCYQSGMLIRYATSSNYYQLLGSRQAWSALSSASKTAVNNYLLNMGGQIWQTLYQQANRIRLGLPVASTALGSASTYQSSGWRPSVPTGAGDGELGFWIGAAAGNLEALSCLGLVWKKSRRLDALLDDEDA